MRDIKEIEYWISKLENGESSFQSYAKLADLYAIRKEMIGTVAEPQIATYSAAAASPLDRYGDSDFLMAVEGRDPGEAWAVMDELMETLKVVNRRVYDSVMRKLEKI